MKYYSSNTIFRFPWDKISMGFWNRYPNPYATHVISEDTVSRKIEDGQLVSKRLLTKKSSAVPKWGEILIRGSRQVFIVEESIVDPKNKTITTYTRNIGLAKVMMIEEKCTYRPCPENSEHTICEREAFISSSFYGLGRAIQSFGVDRFKKNVNKTVKGYEYVLNKMFAPEQVTEAPTPKISAEKIRSTAQRAKELAKSKAASVIVTN